MTELLQRADFELAVLIGVVLLVGVALVGMARRFGPAPAPPAAATTTSSAVPADLSAIEAEVRGLKSRVGDVEHDIKQVRTMMGALPTKDSVYEIGLKVAELQGDLKLNNAHTTATAKGVERIENWLMEEARLKAEAAKRVEGEKKANAA